MVFVHIYKYKRCFYDQCRTVHLILYKTVYNFLCMYLFSFIFVLLNCVLCISKLYLAAIHFLVILSYYYYVNMETHCELYSRHFLTFRCFSNLVILYIHYRCHLPHLRGVIMGKNQISKDNSIQVSEFECKEEDTRRIHFSLTHAYRYISVTEMKILRWIENKEYDRLLLGY